MCLRCGPAYTTLMIFVLGFLGKDGELESVERNGGAGAIIFRQWIWIYIESF